VPLNILIVDDAEFMRFVLRDLLTLGGISGVAEAGSRDEALALAFSLRPEVVVVDTTHPGVGGVDLLAELGALHPAARRVAVIAAGDPALAVAARRAGAEFTLVKPYDPADVATLLLELQAAPTPP
jgi:two-component system chemotaxis response regulator CheY